MFVVLQIRIGRLIGLFGFGVEQHDRSYETAKIQNLKSKISHVIFPQFTA